MYWPPLIYGALASGVVHATTLGYAVLGAPEFRFDRYRETLDAREAAVEVLIHVDRETNPPAADPGPIEAARADAVAGRRSVRAQNHATPEANAPDDPRQAALYRRILSAAEQGVPAAQFAVAERLAKGNGVPADPAAAETMLRRAAERGFVPAQMRLGRKAAAGDSPDDLVEALKWFAFAALRGDGAAEALAAAIEERLPPDLAAQARREAQRLDRLAAATAAPGDRADPRAATNDLARAAETGAPSQIRLALARGTDPNGLDTAGRTALITAAWRGRADLIDALLAWGADADFADGERRTALIWAAGNGHEAAAARLIEAGAAIDRRDALGRTALLRAAWNGHAATVERLLAAGADPNLADRDGHTPLYYARRANQREAARLLAASGGR